MIGGSGPGPSQATGRGGERPRLLCIPGAGASAGRFERLRTRLGDLVEIRTNELPGRGIRFAQPSFPYLTDHFTHFVNHVEGEPYQRWILLGESLGALTATCVADELADSMRAEVIGVITVAASPTVTGRRPRDEVIADLQVDAVAGAGPGSERITLATDTILADIDAAHASRDRVNLRPLSVPMVTIRGVDDGLVTDEGARGWERLAPAGWRYHEVPGNHYQFESPTPEMITALRAAVAFILE